MSGLGSELDAHLVLDLSVQFVDELVAFRASHKVDDFVRSQIPGLQRLQRHVAQRVVNLHYSDYALLVRRRLHILANEVQIGPVAH